MSDAYVEELKARIEADVEPYKAALAAANQATTTLDAAVLDMAANIRRLTDTMDDLAAKAESSGDGFTKLKSALSLAKAAARELEEGLKIAIEAANSMDPQGAIEWKQHLDKLRDAAMTFAGNVGKELRPALEWLMDNGVKAFHFLERIDFKKWGRDVLDTFAAIGQGIVSFWKWVGDKLGEIAVIVVHVLVSPFQALQEMIVGALSGALDFAAGAVGKIVALLGPMNTEKLSAGLGIDLGAMSGQLSSAASAMRDQASRLDIGDELVDQVKDGMSALVKIGADFGAAIGSAASDKLKDSLGRYVRDESTVPADHHFAGKEDVRDQKLDNLADQVRLKAEAQLEGLERARAAASYAAAQAETQIRMAGLQEAAKVQAQSFEEAKKQLREAYATGSSADVAAAKAQVDSSLTKLQGIQAQEEAMVAESARQANVEAALKVSAADDELEAAKAQVEAAAQTIENLKSMAGATKEAQATAKAAAQEAAKDALAAQQEAIKHQEAAIKLQEEADKAHVAAAKLAADHQVDAAKKAAEIQAEADRHAQEVRKFVGNEALNLVQGGGGVTSSVVQGAIKGGEQAGAEGALTGAVTALVSHSKGFSDLMGSFDQIFQTLSNAIGSVLEALVPLIAALGSALAPLFQAFGNVLTYAGRGLTATLLPVVVLLGQLIAPLADLINALAPLGQIIIVLVEISGGPIIAALIALAALMPLLVIAVEWLAKVVGEAVHAITQAWNFILESVQGLLRSLGSLPVVGDEANKMADALEALRIHAVDTGNAMAQAAPPLFQLSAAAQAAAQALLQVQSAIQKNNDDQAKLKAAKDALAYAEAHPNADASKQSAIVDALQKAITQAQNQSMLDFDQAALEGAIFNQQHGGSQDEVDQARMHLALDQARIDAANTEATKANTKATQSVAESLTNLPSGFKLNLEKFYADSGTGAGVSSMNNQGTALGALQGGKLSGSGGPLYVINIQGDVSDGQLRKVESFLRRQGARNGRGLSGIGAPALPGGRR